MNRDFYELHVTVDCNDEQRFRERCRELRVKPLVIELSSGVHKVQFMTSSFLKGELDDVMHSAHDVATALDTYFPVRRLKLEAMLQSRTVPQHCRPGEYFEFHVKIHAPGSFEELQERCGRHGAALSWNARKPQDFLTASRAYGSKEEALAHYNGLLAELRQYKLSNRLREYVCYDSNPQYDEGWI